MLAMAPRGLIHLGSIPFAAKLTAAAIMAVVLFGVIDGLRRWNSRRQARRLTGTFGEVRESYGAVLMGLALMAEQVSRLKKVKRLSLRGVDFLDSHAQNAMSMKEAAKRLPKMSRPRALRQAARLLISFKQQENGFRSFQWEVSRAVCDQAFSGRILPPQPVRRYKAAFTVLQHDVPPVLWPVLEEILASCVSLQAKTKSGEWVKVPLEFADGASAVFSRKYLEKAEELRMKVRHIIGRETVIGFTVEHGFPLKSSNPAPPFPSPPVRPPTLPTAFTPKAISSNSLDPSGVNRPRHPPTPRRPRPWLAQAPPAVQGAQGPRGAAAHPWPAADRKGQANS